MLKLSDGDGIKITAEAEIYYLLSLAFPLASAAAVDDGSLWHTTD